MRRGDAYPSKYLKATDVSEPMTVTIAGVFKSNVGQGEDQEEKVVIEFDGVDKQMVLNATNWDLLEAQYGEDSDMWTGKECTVYADPNVTFGGKKVGGLRIRVGDAWTWAEAVAAAAEVKLTEQEVKDILKAAGQTKWISVTGTPIIKKAIEEAKNPPF